MDEILGSTPFECDLHGEVLYLNLNSVGQKYFGKQENNIWLVLRTTLLSSLISSSFCFSLGDFIK